MTRGTKSGKYTWIHRRPPPPSGGHGMPNKIEIRPLDKKETTGESGGNGGA
ncbi:hypothetical protein GT039_06450 [Streptomyces sp. SID2955]|nr:hypothetical protein [Streptomyces sp. SID2955]